MRKTAPVDPEFSELDRYMFGPVDPIQRTNKRLSLVAALLAGGIVLSLGVNAYQYRRASLAPVRIAFPLPNGQVQTLSLTLTGFSLHHAETQAALESAVASWTERFYSRLRNPLNGEIATRSYFDSFFFMSGELTDVFKQIERRQQTIAGFMAGSDPEFRARKTTVIFRNLDRLPYSADVYFDRIYYSQPLVVAEKRSYVVPIEFSVNPSDEEVEKLRKRMGSDIDTVLAINPLLLQITRIGDEHPFENSSPK
jgi:hypothetical protein